MTHPAPSDRGAWLRILLWLLAALALSLIAVAVD